MFNKRRNAMEYKFRVQTKEEEEKYSITSQICEIYDPSRYADETENVIPLAFGQLQARFGQPLYITKDYENMYRYAICIEAENGEKTYVSAYCGPTGPAIGGFSDDKNTMEAVRALIDYIIEAKPVDYEAEAYYMDGGVRIVQGVKNGVPYLTGGMLDMDDPEIAKLFM